MSRMGLNHWIILGGCLAGVSSLLCSGAALAQLTGNLTVEVVGLQSQEGNVCFKLFSGSQGFPNDNDSTVQRACVAIAATASPTPPELPMTYTFENLDSGSYAVAIYHDRDGDEQLARGAFGAPAEGYGFSNDAPVASTGPASFEDAVILVAGNSTTIQIQVRYP